MRSAKISSSSFWMIGELRWAWFCNWVFNVSSSQGMSLHRRCKRSRKLSLLTSDLCNCPRFDRSSSGPLWAMFWWCFVRRSGFFQSQNVKALSILQKRRTRVASSDIIYWVVQPRIFFEPLYLEISGEFFLPKVCSLYSRRTGCYGPSLVPGLNSRTALSSLCNHEGTNISLTSGSITTSTVWGGEGSGSSIDSWRGT